MDSLHGNCPNILNNKSEFGKSSDFSVPNSECEISSGKADTPDFSFAHSNSFNATVNNTEKYSLNQTYSES